jgi:hypothetical protein
MADIMSNDDSKPYWSNKIWDWCLTPRDSISYFHCAMQNVIPDVTMCNLFVHKKIQNLDMSKQY